MRRWAEGLPDEREHFSPCFGRQSNIRDYLFEHARVTHDLINEENLAASKKAPAQYGDFGDQSIPVALNKEIILLFVVGGAGMHSCWMPSWYGPKHRAVTKKIRIPE